MTSVTLQEVLRSPYVTQSTSLALLKPFLALSHGALFHFPRIIFLAIEGPFIPKFICKFRFNCDKVSTENYFLNLACRLYRETEGILSGLFQYHNVFQFSRKL